MKDAVKALYPPRIRRSESFSSDGFFGGGASGGSMKGSGIGGGALSRLPRDRFSQLLLEHGERHLQDWACAASSSPLCPPPDGSGPAPPAGATATRTRSRSGGTARGAPPISSFRRSASAFAPPSPFGVPPSSSMGRIPGRLRLCTRSVVFEPDDVSRAIIRCPFGKMETAPFTFAGGEAREFSGSAGMGGASGRGLGRTDGAISQNGTKGSSAAAVVRCNRHVLMKAKNAVVPFDTVDVPTEFRFSFLHSSPSDFFELSGKLFGMVKGLEKFGVPREKEKSAKPETPEDLLRPVLDRPFDPSNLADMRERPLTTNLRCRRLTPLLSSPGISIVTKRNLYFQPASGICKTAIASARAHCWALTDVSATARRYDGLKDTALEVYLRRGCAGPCSVLLAFDSPRDRERVISLLPSPQDGVPCHTNRDFVADACSTWRAGDITNFEYLSALNSAAGRTFHDLSRYPVFPWVVSDYSSARLDLSKEETYRDLSKPVGALNEERLQYFKSRYDSMREGDGVSDMGNGGGGIDHRPFLYGTHYSAPGYVLYYMVRQMPEHMLCLQNGKFDAPDRMFHDFRNTFDSVMTNHTDVKELIPEFYDPDGGFDFLINAGGLLLGTTQTGERVHDVHLPPWARSARDFLRKCRKALESEICSSHLPRWIDLVFGCKSRGNGAKEAMNIFHPTAYITPEEFAALPSDEEQARAELQATEFGIVPDLLFSGPHPPKGGLSDEDDVSAPGGGGVIALDTGRAIVTAEGEGNGESRGRSGSDQPWEILDAPPGAGITGAIGFDTADGNNESTAPIKQVKSLSTTGNSVGFGAGAMAPGKMKYSAGVIPERNEKNEQAAASAISKLLSDLPATPDVDALEEEREWVLRMRSGNDADINIGEAFTNLSLKGSGRPGSGAEGGVGRSRTFSSDTGVVPTSHHSTLSLDDGLSRSSSVSQTQRMVTNPNGDDSRCYELIPIVAPSKIHSGAVSGCRLLFPSDASSSCYLTTVSLDGSLLVHTIPALRSWGDGDDRFRTRRSFTAARAGASGKFSSYLSGASVSCSADRGAGSSGSGLLPHRSHSSVEPLACLGPLVPDGSTPGRGHVTFAGGHDNVVFAYGLRSACALASIYAHRDAVTGIDVISRRRGGSPRQPSSPSFSPLRSLGGGGGGGGGPTRHILVTGSWDATVKLWPCSVAPGETISIGREPTAELFDAESGVVCVSATDARGGVGLAVAAGCADGSLIVWMCFDNGGESRQSEDGNDVFSFWWCIALSHRVDHT